MKKAIFRLLVLAIVVAGGYYAYLFFKSGPARGADIATAKVQRGDVVIRAFTRGELKAVRTFQIYAPNLNGTIQVTALAPMGALAREKDLIVEYDDSELRATIDADQLSLDTTDENIKAQKLNMQIQQSRDQLELLSSRFAVTRQELNVQKNPVLDEISAKRNTLALEQSRRSLAATELNVKLHKEQQDSQLDVYASNRRRSVQNLRLDQERLKQTKTLAPMTGLVAIKQNRAQNFNFGQQMPDVRTGDQLQAGMNVADLLDLSEMEMQAKVGEMDRANLKEGQRIMIQLDAVPDKRFKGAIKTLSGTATSDVFSGDPSKKFDVTFSIDMRDLLSGLGMDAAKIQEIMNTAAENAKKNLVSFAPAMAGGRGGRGGGGMDMGGRGGGMMGMDGPDLGLLAAANAGSGQDQGRAFGRGGFGQGRGGDNQQAAQGRQGRGGQDQQAGEGRQGRGGDNQQAGQGRQGRGGQDQQAAQGRQGRGGQDQAAGGRGQNGRGGGEGGGFGGGRGFGGYNTGQSFTDDEREKAQLPKPPDQDSEVGKLLRPGLLAEVEVEVEKIPNALHIPSQAVFRKEGKPTVYVKLANGKFQPREVQLGKGSESTMVILAGLQMGETIALSDPTASKNKQQNTEEKKSGSGTGMPMPGAK